MNLDDDTRTDGYTEIDGSDGPDLPSSEAAESTNEIDFGSGGADCVGEVDTQDSADGKFEVDCGGGEAVAGEGDTAVESETSSAYSRYCDSLTGDLALLTSTWDSLHKAWQATEKRAAYGAPALQKGLTGYAVELRRMRDRVGAQLKKELRKHILWPWLSKHPGVGGVHVARLISMIGDPLRFPGRQCQGKETHHLPDDWTDPCPIGVKKDDKWVTCEAIVGEVRRGTGVRALWHYLGMHVVDGKLARKKKGVQCTWNPAARTALLQPKGVVDQIILHRVEPWRSIFDASKERITRERGVVETEPDTSDGSPPASDSGAEKTNEIEICAGSADSRAEGSSESDVRGGPTEVAVESDNENGRAEGGVDAIAESDSSRGPALLRPFQVHAICRIIAVKAFAGDLLMEWKRALREE